MKKFSLIVLVTVLCFEAINAQAYPNYNSENEVKFNIGLFLANGTVEGSFEHFFNEDMSIGGTLYLDSTSTDYNGNFGIGPNLRAYFGYMPRSGYFVEAFGLYYTGEDLHKENELGIRNNDYSTTAIGLGIGNKWVTQSNKFSFEVSAGIGRNVNPQVYQDTFLFRASVSIGIRI